MNGDLTFNTNDLQTYNTITRVGINTNKIEHTDIPDLLMSVFSKADANGSTIPNINYPTKKITIRGSIHGSSQADLDSRIDTFKGYFNGKDKNLDITYGASTRRYVATKNALSIEREDHALFARFVVEFICTQPFGVDTTATNIANQTAQTGATHTYTPTIAGSAPVQFPIITITINSVTEGGDYIMVSNDNNGQEMVLYDLDFAADDVIVIDAFERTVTRNGDDVDFLGTFLELEPGSNSITITDGFSARNIDILVEYYKRWL